MALPSGRVRPAVPTDAAAIAQVHVQAWHETYTGLMPPAVLDSLSVERRAAFWEKALVHAGLGVFVAEVAGQVVGFVSLGPAAIVPAPIELHALYLLREHQGKQLGRQLWEHALGFARQAEAETLRLWVLKNNPTRGFYEKQGGVATEQRVEELGGVALVEVSYIFRL